MNRTDKLGFGGMSAKRRNCVAILYDTSSTASGPPSPQGEGKSRLLLEEKLSAKLTDEVAKSSTNSNLWQKSAGPRPRPTLFHFQTPTLRKFLFLRLQCCRKPIHHCLWGTNIPANRYLINIHLFHIRLPHSKHKVVQEW